MDGSNGKIVSLLERIAGAQEATNELLDRTNERLQGVERGVAQLWQETRAGFDRVDRRFEQMDRRSERFEERFDRALTFLGGHHADHEQRIKALEDHVFKKSS
jgi:Mg2+ and Co2+ transporter CorA